MLRFLRFVFYLFLIVVVAGSVFIGLEVRDAIQYRSPREEEVLIERGLGLKQMARVLEERRVIRRRWDFEIFLRYLKKENELKAGEYVFLPGMSLEMIVDQILKGRVKQYKFTIPEGYNTRDVCQLLVSKGLITAEGCAAQISRLALVGEAGENKNIKTLEGYLFPETYLYQRSTTPAQHFEQMVAMFYSRVDAGRISRAREKGFSLHELVTFASVIEKETGVAAERPLIAGVFLNRLKVGMPLQSDPTVIYGIENFNGNLTKRDLATDTPYNTYTRPGLPTGPICNPGLDAIDAVLNPDPSEYFYFVAKGGGSHYFSRTLSEHNAAVRFYQLGQGAPPGP